MAITTKKNIEIRYGETDQMGCGLSRELSGFS